VGPRSPGRQRNSGRPVVERVLEPLGIAAASTWFSDCVNTYFVKGGVGSQGAAWTDRYQPFAHAIALPAPTIPDRPTIEELVTIASGDHRPRLRAELLESKSPLVVTLGEEARRVLANIADEVFGPPTKPLTQQADRRIDEDYGEPGTISVDGQTLTWRALVHPGQRSTHWASTHDEWAKRCTQGR
jgi:uracil-DNA glycosylase